MADDGASADEFGFSVALDGDTAVVGAGMADVGDKIDQGKVCFFERQPLAQTISFLPVADGDVGGPDLLEATAPYLILL